MKVALLNDLPVAGVLTSGFGSGAELSSGRFLWEGHRRGHIADVVTPEYLHPGLLAQYDVVVTKNLTKFNNDQLAEITRHKYVAWPSDYMWNKWRLYFGFQESDRVRPETREWEAFFTNSLFNVFLSPLHRECHVWAMPKVADHPYLDAPPAVNVDLFHPAKDGWTPNTAVNINGLLDFKGLKGHGGAAGNLDWAHANRGKQITFIGGSRENVNLPGNAKFVGPKSQSEVASILSLTETYFEFPMSPMPFDRTAVEGLLSCKRVETNRLCGAASYDWFKRADRAAARDACRGGAAVIWERLQSEVSL